MLTVLIRYEAISPAVLANRIERSYAGSLCVWVDVDDDYCEFTVFCFDDFEGLEDVLAEYMQRASPAEMRGLLCRRAGVCYNKYRKRGKIIWMIWKL